MTIDTTKLRELAQKATPGPWLVENYDPGINEIYTGSGEHHREVVGTPPCDGGIPAISDNDAEYIAAANPATVLALLDECETLRADKAHVTTTLESTSKLLNDAVDLVEKKNAQLVRLRKIEAAAKNLAKVKGRHHSEQAMNQLLDALKS